MVAHPDSRPAVIDLPTRRDERGLLLVAGAVALLLHLIFLALPIARPAVIYETPDKKPPRLLSPTPIRPPPLPDEPIVAPPPSEDRRRLLVPEREPDDFEPIREPSPPPPVIDDVDLVLIPDSPAPPPEDPGRVFSEEMEGLVVPVGLSDRSPPVYPESARRVGLEGRVVLRAVICEDGSVESVEVLRAPRPDLGFSHAAIAAVSAWRYEPGRLRGRPVAVSMTVVVDFTLR